MVALGVKQKHRTERATKLENAEGKIKFPRIEYLETAQGCDEMLLGDLNAP